MPKKPKPKKPKPDKSNLMRTRKDRAGQKTLRGDLIIPIPKAGEFLGALKKAAPKKPRESGSSSP